MRERYIYDRLAMEVVTAEEHARRREARKFDNPPRKRVNVISDIEPYKATIGDRIIGSRSEHRNYLRENNAVEVGNEKPQFMKEAERRQREEHGRQRD